MAKKLLWVIVSKAHLSKIWSIALSKELVPLLWGTETQTRMCWIYFWYSHGSISDRTQLEGAHVTHFSSSTHGFMPVGEVNDSGNAWKQVCITLAMLWFSWCKMKNYLPDYVNLCQDLIHKVQENEQQIMQLRRYLTDCSVKVSPAATSYFTFVAPWDVV